MERTVLNAIARCRTSHFEDNLTSRNIFLGKWSPVLLNHETPMKRTARSLLLVLILGALSHSHVLGETFKPDADGFIRDWLMLAPLPLEEGETGPDAIGFNVIRREAALQPKESDEMTVVGYDLTWRKVHSDREIIDFNQVLGEQTDNAIAYLVAYIDSPRELTDVTMLVGRNDQARVYFNGATILTNPEGGALNKDSDIVENLTLHKGLNTVILKVVNEAGNWQACLRFTTGDGKPLTNYAITLDP